MTMLRRVRSWFGAVVRRSRMEREMDAELRFHIEAFAEDLVGSGVSREEALRRACIEFGGVERAKEECRDALALRLVDHVARDLRFGVRLLIKNPGFTAVAVIALALGIGADTAMYSIVKGALSWDFGLDHPDRVFGQRVPARSDCGCAWLCGTRPTSDESGSDGGAAL